MIKSSICHQASLYIQTICFLVVFFLEIVQKSISVFEQISQIRNKPELSKYFSQNDDRQFSTRPPPIHVRLFFYIGGVVDGQHNCNTNTHTHTFIMRTQGSAIISLRVVRERHLKVSKAARYATKQKRVHARTLCVV